MPMALGIKPNKWILREKRINWSMNLIKKKKIEL